MTQIHHEAGKPALSETAPDITSQATDSTRLVFQSCAVGVAVAGSILVNAFSPGTRAAWQALLDQKGQVILLALAAMFAGFGVAVVLYHRLNNQRSDQLEDDYRSLMARADALLEKYPSRRGDQKVDSVGAR